MATVFNDTTADHKWSTAGNWSDGVPDAADAVTIGAAVTSLIVDAAATCLSLDMTGAAADFVLSGASGLIVAGNVTWKASSVTTQTYSGTLTITANCTFTSNAMTLGCNVSHFTAATTLTLADALNIGAKTLFINRGTFVSNSFALTCDVFGDNGGGAAKTLTLGTSAITCTNVAFTGINPTVTHTGTITINVTTTRNLDFGDSTGWGNIVFNMSPAANNVIYNIQGGNWGAISFTADLLTAMTGTQITLLANYAGSISCSGDSPTNYLTVQSSDGATQRTLTDSAGTNTWTDVYIADMNATGGATWTTSGCTNVDNNAGDWDFLAAVGLKIPVAMHHRKQQGFS